MHVPGSGDSGGLNVYVRNLAIALSRAGLRCDIYTRRDDPDLPDRSPLAAHADVIAVDAGPAERIAKADASAYLPEFTRVVTDAATDGVYDIVHSHYWMSGIAALDVGSKLDLPIVHTAHTLSPVRALPDGGAQRVEAERELARRADLLVANTPFDAQALATAFQADPACVDVIPPGVDHDLFTPGDKATARQYSDLDGDRLVVLYAGRIQRLKGADLVTDALIRLSGRRPDLANRVTLIVAGGPSGADGDDTFSLMRAQAMHPAMQAEVRFVDPLPQCELVNLYRAADVCVVPSRSETFGLVALEAQACGLPVVATDVDGLGYVVGPSGGLVVPSASAELISHELERVLDDDSLRGRLARGAQVDAARFSWGVTAARHCLAYGELLAPDGVAICG